MTTRYSPSDTLDRLPELRGAIERLAALPPAEDTASEAAAIRSLVGAGLGALRVDRERGGGGLALPEFFDVVIAVASVDSNIPHALIQHFFLVEAARSQDDEHSRALLDAVAGGLILGAAISEPAGVALGRIETAVTPLSEGGYRLDGRKEYTTGVLYADLVTVVAAGPDGGVVRATVPTDRPGVRVNDDWDGIGQVGSASGTVSFDAVPLDASELAPWTEPTLQLPDQQQLLILATLAGIADSAARHATDLLRRRRRIYAFGSGDAPRHDPVLQTTAGEFWATASAARAIVLDAARRIDAAFASAGEAGFPDRLVRADVAVLEAQGTVVPLVLGQTSRVFDALGGSAVAAAAGLDRHWRNARTLASHNPVAYKLRQVGDYRLNGAAPEQVSVVRGFAGVRPDGGPPHGSDAEASEPEAEASDSTEAGREE